MFKSIDKKFKKIGFIKVEENEYGVRYERMDECHDYVQVHYSQESRHVF